MRWLAVIAVPPCVMLCCVYGQMCASINDDATPRARGFVTVAVVPVPAHPARVREGRHGEKRWMSQLMVCILAIYRRCFPASPSDV